MATGTDAAAKTGGENEIRQLRSELEKVKAEFEARLSALEAALPKMAMAEAEEPVSAETLAIIGAAVTAYLGKKVRIRSARLIQPGNQWKQSGRASLQASHNLKW